MNKLIVKVFGILALVSGFTACRNQEEISHTSFKTITLKADSLEIPHRWSASIVGKNDVIVSPLTSGQLMKVCVTEGQKVRKGEPLFIIDSRQQELALETAKANLQAALANCESLKLEYESNKNLFDKQIVSSYLLEKALNDYNTAQAAVAQARAVVTSAQVELGYCTVRANTEGMVGHIPNNPGDVVSQVTKLTTISGNSEMSAKFSITETAIQSLIEEAGSVDKAIAILPEVSLILKNGTVYPKKGRIVSISGVVDNTTGTVVCRANFPNTDGILYSGIQGSVELMLGYENMIVVPLSAIVRLQDKSIVYRVKDNCAESVIVEVQDLTDGKNAVIVSGVQEGDVIVAEGANNVYDGQQVIFPEEEKKTEK